MSGIIVPRNFKLLEEVCKSTIYCCIGDNGVMMFSWKPVRKEPVI